MIAMLIKVTALIAALMHSGSSRCISGRPKIFAGEAKRSLDFILCDSHP